MREGEEGETRENRGGRREGEGEGGQRKDETTGDVVGKNPLEDEVDNGDRLAGVTREEKTPWEATRPNLQKRGRGDKAGEEVTDPQRCLGW